MAARIEPARLAIARSAAGGIMRSSVATRYQLAFDRHAGPVKVPARASTPVGHLRIGEERGLLIGQTAGER
jgi:hypothetical protein